MPVPVKKSPLESFQRWGILAAAVALSFSAVRAADKPVKPVVITDHGVLWNDPADETTRDLYYGIGGKEHQPHGPFTFVKEDLAGTSPKLDVTDQDGTKWKLKLGLEARSENAASRLVWATGYFTPEDYFVADTQVSGLPPRLRRGQKLIGPNGAVHNVRLKREAKGEKKVGTWSWKNDPFNGSQQWNGLRTLMAVIDNWDLKDENNSVYKKDSENIYMVSDLGATFSAPGRSYPRNRAKDNLERYTNSKFIVRTTEDTVDFANPARPSFEYLVSLKEYFARVHLEYLGRNVPRADARWLGNLLARLSPDQIRDAFRASGYSPNEIDAFSQVLRERIEALTAL